MAKRFTDTNKYKKPFIRGLKGPYKLLWDFLYHECDHSGIWIVDFEVAQLYLGPDMKINRQTAISLFNSDEARIIEFQYGQLTEKNRAHTGVISALKKHGFVDNDLKLTFENKPLTSPLQGVKYKDMDKEQEKDKDIYGFVAFEFLPMFTRWMEYKKKRGEKYKSIDSEQTFYRNLLKLSENNPITAHQIIEKAIGNNWAGIHELKNQENGKSNNTPPIKHGRIDEERLKDALRFTTAVDELERKRQENNNGNMQL